LGLYFLRARYLDVQSGRFWTQDSWEGDKEAPASIHKYLYAHSDPINKLDPTGHSVLDGVIATTIGFTLAAMPTLSVNGTIPPVGRQLGIAIEVPEPSAVQNDVLNAAIDPGHTFVYIKERGKVVSLLSFGPGTPIGATNKNQFLNGTLPGNPHWPLQGNANTWEFFLTVLEAEEAKKEITRIKTQVPNYTPTNQCTSVSLSVAAKTRVKLPDGIGRVIARAYGYTPYNNRVENPYHLNQQMTAMFGKPTVVNTNTFPSP
jgi:hypothetical protein